MNEITEGVITRSHFEVINGEEILHIECKQKNGWYCGFHFCENTSYEILRQYDDNPGGKDPKTLIGKEIIFKEHPEGRTLGGPAPIAIKFITDKWFYREKDDHEII